MTVKTTEIDIELLRQKFIYNPETGEFSHRKNGKPAFVLVGADGYVRGSYKYAVIGRVPLMAHRVAFALMEGRWPNGDIDHLNGIRTDNRWSNLRECSHQENLMNKGVRRRENSAPPLGITILPSGSFRVQIQYKGNSVTQKTFKSLDDALAHRNMVYDQYGFSPRHGGRDKEAA